MSNVLAETPRRVVGKKQVIKAARAGELSEMFVAADADEPLRKELISAANEAGIRHTMISTRKKLGEACGIKVPAACAGVIKTDK